MKRNRITAMAMIFAVILIMAASYAFVGLHAEHSCDREHCQVCEQIDLCLSRIQMPAALFWMLLSVVSGLHICRSVSVLSRLDMLIQSPVSLKVKLSD